MRPFEASILRVVWPCAAHAPSNQPKVFHSLADGRRSPLDVFDRISRFLRNRMVVSFAAFVADFSTVEISRPYSRSRRHRLQAILADDDVAEHVRACLEAPCRRDNHDRRQGTGEASPDYGSHGVTRISHDSG